MRRGVARVHGERPCQDGEGLGPVREDVRREHPRRRLEVRRATLAEPLAGEAAVVREERIPLRPRHPRLAHDTRGRIRRGEDLERVAVETEPDVLGGDLQDAFGIAGQVGHHEGVASPGKPRLIAEEGTHRVGGPCRGEDGARIRCPALRARQHRRDAGEPRRSGGVEHRAAHPGVGPGEVAGPGIKRRQPVHRRRPQHAELLDLLEQQPGAQRVAEREARQGQVIRRLVVGAVACQGVVEQRLRGGVLHLGDGEAPGRALQREARGEPGEPGAVRDQRAEHRTVALQLVAGLQPLSFGALLRLRHAPLRHRARPDQRLRRVVEHPLGVGEEDGAVPVAQRDGERALAGGDPAAGAVGRGGGEADPAARDRAPRAPQLDGRVRQRPRHVEGDVHGGGVAGCLAPQVQRGVRRGAHQAAELAHRQPVLVEADALLRLEVGVRLLVAEQPRLDLDVRAAVVREGPPPVEPVGVAAPGPDLLRRQVARRGVVHHAGVRRRVVDGHPRLAAAVRESRHRAGPMVADHAVVGAAAVHRPGVHVAEAVRRREAHRVEDARIVGDPHAGVGPPVEAAPHVAAVVERGGLLQHRPPGPQGELHDPLHPVDAVDVADPYGAAAVEVPREREVHRGGGHPVVRDGEVEFDAERRPGAAVGDAGQLDRRVRVEHLRAVQLVRAAVEVAAEVGEDGAAQVLVLEPDGAPGPRFPPVGEAVAEGVRIVGPPVGEDVEGRVRVGGALDGRGQREGAVPDAGGLGRRRLRAGVGDREGPQHGDDRQR